MELLKGNFPDEILNDFGISLDFPYLVISFRKFVYLHTDMPEHQNIEYKSAWHEDYLKWVCGI